MRSNRSAIGARVRVDIDTPSGARSVDRTVNSGSSFGDSPLELHIGIGDAAGVRRVEVRWPSGAVSQVSGLAPGRVYYWREDRAVPEAVKTPKSKPFSKEPVAPHKH